ncbi:hypothetical protein [Arthrobacter sp. GMC3]|uniref:hypothetical protein n=1 Tax=Arthrobacter sp. GMC3 TaxID=2058894 RepID=UPI000CE3793F|nr:hypothetical protein [Arthrobacter sp. GMC3]
MKKLWASSVLFIAGATLVTGCTITDNTVPASATSTPSALPSEVPYPAPTAAVDTMLTITLLSGNAMAVTTRQLSCNGTKAVEGTNFPEGDMACAAVLASGKLLQSTPKPNDEHVCTGTNDQNIADVFGIADGKQIRVSFTRSNVCNIKVWDKLTSLIGTGH